MKFGGSSLADGERIGRAAEIVARRAERRPLIVCSALGGSTDLLLAAYGHALRREREAIQERLAELERRQRWALGGAVDAADRRHEVELQLDALFDELRQLLRAVRTLAEDSPRVRDAVLAFGELLSTRVVVAAFREHGIAAHWCDPRELIVTDARHGAGRALAQATELRCRERLLPLVDAGEVPVIGGFVGRSESGETTTLGRGGGDTTAAVLGAAVAVEEIQIWTDVPGMMTADPRSVPAARPLRRLSYPLAAEIADLGARVLHPDAIAPAVEAAVPVRVLCSLEPEREGTVIVGGEVSAGEAPLAAVVSRRGLGPAAEPASMLGLRVGRHRIDYGSVEEGGCAMVSVVGAGIARDPSLRGKVAGALAALPTRALVSGASPYSVSAVVDRDGLEGSVRELHAVFFE